MRSTPVMSDSALILAHQSGDMSAFSTLMERHRDPVMGFLVNRVGEDAEDLFQETWSRVGSNLHSYNEIGSFRAWVFQIARRLVIDHHRRRSARITLVLPADNSTPSSIDHQQPFSNVAAADIATAFNEALDSMSEPTAEVVRLRLIDGQPFKAIAAHQGVPMNTALGRMHRGLKLIRATLEKRGLIDTGESS